MKTKISAKEIRAHIETGIIQALERMGGFVPSKKIRNVVTKASKEIAYRVKLEMKKSIKRANSALKASTKNLKEKNDRVVES